MAVEATQMLSPEAVQNLVSSYRRLLEIEQTLCDETKEHMREIKKDIESLQGQCPHQNTKEVPAMDGPDVKYEEYCSDCGKYLGRC